MTVEMVCTVEMTSARAVDAVNTQNANVSQIPLPGEMSKLFNISYR